MTHASVGRFSKPIFLQTFQTLLLVLALIGFASRGWAQGGTVVAWGDNRYGQVNVPPDLSNVVAVAAGEWHNLALKADGTLVAWGVNNAGQASIPSDIGTVVAIATGGYHNLVVKPDGTVRAWGQNDFGQTDVPAGLNHVVAVAGGWTHSLALKSDGTVVAWGRNIESQATVPAGLDHVIAISAGEYHNLALKSDGTIVAWGWSGLGQCAIPADLGNNVIGISASGMHSMALKSDGTVRAWGWNQYGQTDVPAGLSHVIAIKGGAEHSLALRSDGTVVGWGSNEAWAESDPDCTYIGNHCPRKYSGQIDIPDGLSGVTAISAGNFHSIALKGKATSTSTARFTLTKNISPAGSGTINATAPGGDGKYASNTLVTLTAIPATNKVFTGWSGAVSGTSNPIHIIMNGNKTVTANFAAVPTNTVHLTVNASPSSAGSISVTPYSASGNYVVGTVVTLTAQPNGDNTFAAWYGGASGISNQVSVVMNGNKTVHALFNNPGKLLFQLSDSRLATWFMQNTQRVATAMLNNGVRAGSNWQLAGAGDVDSNGSKDLIFRGNNGQLAFWLMNGNQKTSSALWKTGKVIPNVCRLVGADDFNSDSKADILWENTANRALSVWLMDGVVNTSTVKLTNTVAPGWHAVATGKFDGNNSADIVFQAANGNIALWLMNGFVRESSVSVRKGATPGSGFVAVGATDIDGDGNTDVLFQRPDGFLKVWFMEGAAFKREVTLSATVASGWNLRAVK